MPVRETILPLGGDAHCKEPRNLLGASRHHPGHTTTSRHRFTPATLGGDGLAPGSDRGLPLRRHPTPRPSRLRSPASTGTARSNVGFWTGRVAARATSTGARVLVRIKGRSNLNKITNHAVTCSQSSQHRKELRHHTTAQAATGKPHTRFGPHPLERVRFRSTHSETPLLSEEHRPRGFYP